MQSGVAIYALDVKLRWDEVRHHGTEMRIYDESSSERSCRRESHANDTSLLYESPQRSPGWRFTAGCTSCRLLRKQTTIMLLEELVSKSHTIKTQKDITMSGKIAGNIKPTLCICFGWFFINISGFINSLGLASCVVQDILSVCFIGLQRGHPENPYAKDWSCQGPAHDAHLKEFRLWRD